MARLRKYGGKGRISWGTSDDEGGESREEYEKRILADEPDDPPAPDELQQLIAEQEADQASTCFILTPVDEEDEYVAHEGEKGLIPMGRRNSKDFSNDGYTGHRTNNKGGWIRRNLGQKPEYKDRGLRAAGSGKARIKTMNS